MAQLYITTHNADGKAVLSAKSPTPPHRIKAGDDTYLDIIYSSPKLPPSVAGDAELDEYAHEHTSATSKGGIMPPNGTSVYVMDFGPGEEYPMHRTLTLDVITVLEGDLEMKLDSGETCVLHQGDTVVQRASHHSWKNVTPDGRRCRALGYILPVELPLMTGGKERKLAMEFKST